MNKQEALQKIKELQEYIEECDRVHTKLKRGGLYKHRCGDIYMLTDRCKLFTLFCIRGTAVGTDYTRDSGFDGNDSYFTYIGQSVDILTIRQ